MSWLQKAAWGMGLGYLAAATALGACGGSGTQADSPAGSSGAAESRPNRPAEPAEPPGPDCSDGSCARCGDGICPVGFYCDEKAAGGPACSWLPECKRKLDCACVEATLGEACRCEARDGGIYVTCS